MTTLLQDKKSNFHVLSGLMSNPDILNNTQEYSVQVEDFPERYHKIIFGAIYNLHQQGIEEITPVSIDGLLSTLPVQYDVFNSNGGVEYLFKMEELGESENFNYFYNRMKKYSLLRAYSSNGVNISDIYDVTMVDVKESEKQQEIFDVMGIEDIVKHVESKLIEIKDSFLFDSENKGGHMSDNIEDILEQKMEKPTYGANLASSYYTAATRGAMFKKVHLISAASGVGKSRFALANMLTICVPEKWDSKKQEWIKTGATGRGVYIGTELEEDEVKIPALCYIADVDEDKLQNARLTEDEKTRLRKAVVILKETPFWYEQLHDFDLDDIEHVIVKNINKNDVSYIAHDYIHASMKIYTSMAKAGAKNMQEHQVLYQISVKLKEIANKHNIFLLTSTQLNANYKDQENMDDSALSGSKAIAQKVDIGGLLLNITAKDEEIIDAVMGGQNGGQGMFGKRPNLSLNIYKNRGNKWKLIRIWMYFNHGTLHCEDLFVTNYKGELIPDIEPLHIVFEQMEEVDEKDIPESIINETININPHTLVDLETGEILPSLSEEAEEAPKQEFNF